MVSLHFYRGLGWLVAVAASLYGGTSVAQTPSVTPDAATVLRVHAAGSLREPLSMVARTYEETTGVRIGLTCGVP